MMQPNLRDETERILEQPVPDAVWNYLVKEGKVQKVEVGQKNIDWLLEEIFKLDNLTNGKLLRNAPPPVDMLDRHTTVVRSREEGLSRLCAKEARLDEAVREFRTNALKNHLLPPEEVETWIHRQAKSESGPSKLLRNIPYEGTCKMTVEGMVLSPPLHLRVVPQGGGFRRRLLSYGMPGDTHARHIFISIGGVLDQLSRLSEQLSSRFSWDPGQSVIFVLTDRIPWVRSIHAAFHGNGRITLDIDPSTTPQEVAVRYKAVRNKVTNGERIRALSTKHMTLAAFMADRPVEAWSLRMQAWNESRPKKWRYKAESNFRRDAAQAVKRSAKLRKTSEQSLVTLMGILAKDNKVKSGAEA